MKLLTISHISNMRAPFKNAISSGLDLTCTCVESTYALKYLAQLQVPFDARSCLRKFLLCATKLYAYPYSVLASMIVWGYDVI